MEERLKLEIIQALTKICMDTEWRKLTTRRRKWEVFADAIKVAALQPDFLRFWEKLQQRLGLSAVNEERGRLDYLQENSKEVLKALRRYPAYYALAAIDESKRKFEILRSKKEEKENEENL